MKTIVVTATSKLWEDAQNIGVYTNSTIDSKLSDVGFIHATSPDQTIAMINRHFTERSDILLLLINIDKVKSEVKFEAPLSGRGGVYSHIYGELNVDSVYLTISPDKDESGNFVEPKELAEASS